MINLSISYTPFKLKVTQLQLFSFRGAMQPYDFPKLMRIFQSCQILYQGAYPNLRRHIQNIHEFLISISDLLFAENLSLKLAFFKTKLNFFSLW